MKPTPTTIALLIILFCSCTRPGSGTFMYWHYMGNVNEYDRMSTAVSNMIDPSDEAQGKAHEMTRSLIARIEATEAALFAASDQADIRRSGKEGVPDMTKLLDHTHSSLYLIGPEPARPSTDTGSAEYIRSSIEQYVDAMARALQLERTAVQAILHTGDIRDPDGLLNYWSTGKFYHLPLISALDRLNTLKKEVLMVELLALKSCRELAKPSSEKAELPKDLASKDHT